jgi:hypothetical protein
LTLKFTPQAAQHIFNLFNTLVLPEYPTDPEDRLIMLHMLNIYRKLRAKLEGGFNYNIGVTEQEALAYWCYFRCKDLTLFPYESNVIQAHITEIDKGIKKRTHTINPHLTKLLN